MEAHVIVHSVFCFTLLCVCTLHFLCVCLEGHSALLHTPRFQWGRPFSVGDPIFLLSTVYGLPPLSPLSTLPLFFFFNETGARSSVSSAKINFFAGAPAIFHMAFFFLPVKRHCLQGWCLGGVQGVLRRVWGAREDAQAPESQGERDRGVHCPT